MLSRGSLNLRWYTEFSRRRICDDMTSNKPNYVNRGFTELAAAVPKNEPQPASNVIPFDRWLESIDKTQATGWRWRQRGWIVTLNICGRAYISRDEIRRFEDRAASGEFSKIHATPQRKGETNGAHLGIAGRVPFGGSKDGARPFTRAAFDAHAQLTPQFWIPPKTRAKLENPAAPGGRNHQMVETVLSLIAQGLCPDAIFAQYRSMYQQDVTDGEIRKVIEWGLAKNPQPCGIWRGRMRLSVGR